MIDSDIQDVPMHYRALETKCKEIGFTMPSDMYIGTLLKTLLSSKPKSNNLELGTGIGLSLVWMIEGMDSQSKLTTVDNDPELIRIARSYFGNDKRINIVCDDGSHWIKNYKGAKFDIVFADTWPGKYSELEETLDLVKKGGFYIIDDMNPQPIWPEGHAEKAQKLILYLESRKDLSLTKMNWSTGIIICTKKVK